MLNQTILVGRVQDTIKVDQRILGEPAFKLIINIERPGKSKTIDHIPVFMKEHLYDGVKSYLVDNKLVALKAHIENIHPIIKYDLDHIGVVVDKITLLSDPS